MAAVAPTYQQLKEQALCAQGCGAPAADDHELCPAHRDAKRDRQAKWVQRKRKRLRRQRRCGDCQCELKPGERIWCTAHRIRRNRVSALRVADVDVSVDKSERVAAATREHADGRTRYHGQQRRGQQTHAQLNRQDVGMAESCFEAFKAGIQLLGSDEVKAWPRGERNAVTKATANQGERCGRHIDDVLERIGHFQQRHGRRDGEG